MPLELIYAMFEKLSGETNIKIVPHLDHGENYDICKKALDIGFTSIMYDGSKLSFKENLNQSLKIYELTQKYNACLEVELGFVGYNDISKNNDEDNDNDMRTDRDECKGEDKDNGQG